MLVYVVVALCAAVALLLVHRYDLHDREPWHMTALACAAGAAAMWLLGFAEDAAIDLFGPSPPDAAVAAVAALFEEGTRLVIVVAIALAVRRHFNDPLDGLVYGSIVGLGMGVSESISHVERVQVGAALPAAELVRVFSHVALGGIVGFPAGMMRFGKRRWPAAMALCAGGAAALHWAWDWIALASTPAGGGALPWLAAFLMLLGLGTYGTLTALGAEWSRRVFAPASTRSLFRWPLTLVVGTRESGAATRPTRPATVPARGFRASIVRLATLATWLAAAATIAGFASGLGWPVELACHFRVQYFWTLAAAAVVLAPAGRRYEAGMAAVLALVNLAVVLPLYVAPKAPPPPAGGPSITALNANITSSNPDHAAVLSLIDDVDADLVLLEEVTSSWLESLEPLRRTHPHAVVRPREDNFGIALFSRLPLDGAEVIFPGDAGVPSVTARIEVGGRSVTFFGAHPAPPVGPRSAAWRDDQIAALARRVRATNGPVLLLGDLNVTPWSRVFEELVEATGLVSASRGRGVQATWPATFPPLLIPIDHCLHTPDIAVLRQEVGPHIGSDHYPLIFEFTVREHGE